jgi:hypothetical protein
MKVARYEVPGNRKNQARPVGNGMIGATGTFCDLELGTREQINSDRTLPPSPSWLWRTRRDGSFFKRFPGNKLPGYLHLVPLGQMPILRPVHKVDTTSETPHRLYRSPFQSQRSTEDFPTQITEHEDD